MVYAEKVNDKWNDSMSWFCVFIQSVYQQTIVYNIQVILFILFTISDMWYTRTYTYRL